MSPVFAIISHVMEKKRLVTVIMTLAVIGLLLLPHGQLTATRGGGVGKSAATETTGGEEPHLGNVARAKAILAETPADIDPRFIGRGKYLLDAERAWLRDSARKRKAALAVVAGEGAPGQEAAVGAGGAAGYVWTAPSGPARQAPGAVVASIEESLGRPAFEDNALRYLEWRETCPPAYQHLIQTGRALILGQPIYPATEEFKKAAILAYSGYRWDMWLKHMGFPHSPFYGIGLECVVYLYSRGRPWENALIVLEFESTFGLGAPGNPFGFGSTSNIVAYCDFLDNGLGYRCPDDVNGMVEYYHNPEHAGHAKYRQSFHDRMIQIQAFLPE